MKTLIKHTTARQTILIAGFLFAGAAALNAQSRANRAQDTKSNPDPPKLELVALNTPKVSPFSVTPASIPTPPIPAPQTQADQNRNDQNAQAPAMAQAAAQAHAAELVKKAIAPTDVRAAAMKDGTTNKKNFWFTAGPDAFPPPVRMDPTFGLPVSPYGAGPAAVAFNFGKN